MASNFLSSRANIPSSSSSAAPLLAVSTDRPESELKVTYFWKENFRHGDKPGNYVPSLASFIEI